MIPLLLTIPCCQQAPPRVCWEAGVHVTPTSTEFETRAVASGDTEAFGRFYERWFDEVYEEVRRLTRLDESFCLDVVQEVMMRVIRSLTPMDTEAQVRAWLWTVTRSCAIDRLRSESRRARREQSRAPSNPSGAEPRAVELDERLGWLRGELDRLDEPNLRLLLLRYRFGWTLAQIGESLGLKPGAVDGRLGRLVGSLRRKAAEEFDGT